jgi:hypothetical protein
MEWFLPTLRAGFCSMAFLEPGRGAKIREHSEIFRFSSAVASDGSGINNYYVIACGARFLVFKNTKKINE